MGNAAGISNAGETVSSPVNNCFVTLCRVHRIMGYYVDEIHILTMLAVLKQHDFEIKPLSHGYMVSYFCELRKGVPPWPGEILDRAMRDALPANQRNTIMRGLRWIFA
jgi:hypothetical protein